MKKIEREKRKKKRKKRHHLTSRGLLLGQIKREGDTPLFPPRLSLFTHSLKFCVPSCVPTALSPCFVYFSLELLTALPCVNHCSYILSVRYIHLSSASRCWFALIARVCSSFFLFLQSGSFQPACQESSRLTPLHRGSVLDI